MNSTEQEVPYKLPDEGSTEIHLKFPPDFMPEGMYILAWIHPFEILTATLIID
jgi:hypothetical protein